VDGVCDGAVEPFGAELAVQAGDLVTELVVVLGEFADALVGQGKTSAQRCVAARLDGRWWGDEPVIAQGGETVAKVGFGVEPGAGHAGFSELKMILIR
jgi:hypothetical protein